MIAGGILVLGAAPAQADVASPDKPKPSPAETPDDDPMGTALAWTRGLRLSGPTGDDPVGRDGVFTLDRGTQRLFQVTFGQDDAAGDEPGKEKATRADRHRARPAREAGRGGNRFAGSVSSPLLGGARVTVTGALLPDGSRATESGPAARLAPADRDVRPASGMPPGGSPIAPGDLLPGPTPQPSDSPAPPYGPAGPARPGLDPSAPAVVSPSAPVAEDPSAPAATDPSTPAATDPAAAATVEPSAAAAGDPAGTDPSVLVDPAGTGPSVLVDPAPSGTPSPAPSSTPTAKIDDPRLNEEPIDAN
ncbi:hypothetical protein FHX34_1011052 [Actinoplanes teichomyceticus]|uniref:Uncharacterized protein n=2 Tax=Actinoplanes teichomyceticus TaxID=1867 RepID=A0A561WQF3_ACTTI|nr:hypothetical protein FHX34_1011052 [Actinoplanes teichomyceticus]